MSVIDEIPEVLNHLQKSFVSTRSTSSKHSTTINIDDSDTTIYLSIIWYESRIGAAIYDSETSMVNVLLDTLELEPFENVHKLLEEFGSDVIITSSKLDDRMLKVMKSYCSTGGGGDGDKTKESVVNHSNTADTSGLNQTTQANQNLSSLKMLSSLEFGYEASIRRILSVNLPGMTDDLTDTEKKFFLSSLLPLDCVCAIRAFGGLLRYLQKNRVGVGLESADVQTPISGIETFTLKNVLFIDRSSLESLQIFQQVHHPSVFKTSSKEGLSLFAVLNRTRTFVGRKLLRSWFYRPTSDAAVLKRRHEAIAFFLHARNSELTHGIADHLRRIGNVTRILSRLRTSTLSVNDWNCVMKTSQNALRIADACRSVLSNRKEETPQVLIDVVQHFTGDLVTIVNRINSVVDADASKSDGVFTVKAGVCGSLDELRLRYARLPSVLSRIADEELATYTEYISTCQVVYMRRIGYLLFIYKTDEMKSSNNFSIPGVEFIAQSPQTVYYKTPATYRLDNDFGDILEIISDKQVRIGIELQDIIAGEAPVLLDVSRLTAELDCLMSFATVAREFSYVRPHITSAKGIHVKKARHPLQEHTVSLFVANDIDLADEAGGGAIQVLTGPNASGKSVYLKQVGLIAYMAHIGSYIPAEAGEIGRLSRIFTKIRSEDSLSSGLSSFASDLAQMSQAINKASGKCLVLIDEFGKGTSTVDGQSLLHACLSYWGEVPDSPLVVCTTHFRGVTQTLRSPAIKFVTMEAVETEASKVVFLYQLAQGNTLFIHEVVLRKQPGSK